MFRQTLLRLSPSRLSVRARLGLIQLMLLTSLALICATAWHLLSVERELGLKMALLSRAERHHLEGDMMHDALHAEVEHALRIGRTNPAAAAAVLATVRENAHRYRTELAALQTLPLPATLSRTLAENRTYALQYIASATELAAAAVADPSRAAEMESAFTLAFDDLLERNDQVTRTFITLVEDGERAIFAAENTGKLWILVTSLATMITAWIFVAIIAQSIRRSLRQVSEAARALAAGNLTARSEVASHDEVGELAISMNKMADDLQNMVDKLLAEADRDAFAAQLTQALEMAESESDVRGVLTRAMPQISPSSQMELLAAEGTSQQISRIVEHPTAGAPGCGVDTLSSCTAVRRGSPQVFNDSEVLNACPRLRGRSCGPISAVCVPLSFMGRAFGVLHMTAPVRKPLPPQKVAQVTTLGMQAGNRIGTLRAFAHTRRQAKTDGLTGISNRRALEELIPDLIVGGSPYAFALADLDFFKRLNDSHGHDAGDRALRLFSDVISESVRTGDQVARWGGEEFALLFPGLSAAEALEVVERIRMNLAETLLTSGSPSFTASFGLADSRMSDSFDGVKQLADEALYESKAAGRDCATVHGGSRVHYPSSHLGKVG